MTANQRLLAHKNKGGFTFIGLRAANKQYALVRSKVGLSHRVGNWLTRYDQNTKYAHTSERLTFGLSLMPARSAYAWAKCHGMAFATDALAAFSVCDWSTRGCRKVCVAFAGKGKFDNTQAGRTARTLLWAVDPDAAYTLLVHHLRRIVRKYGAERVAIRLNTFSDIAWENVLPAEFWAEFAQVQFYDYTKSEARALSLDLPPNYDITYSASERDDVDSIRMMARQTRVAVVIGQAANAPKPDTWAGMFVADGNATDARYNEPSYSTIVLLGALGKAAHQKVGVREFVKPVRVP